MLVKVNYGSKSWDFVTIDMDHSGVDEVEDADDAPMALLSYILRECMEDAEGRVYFTLNDVLIECVYGERSNGDSVIIEPESMDSEFDSLLATCEKLVKLRELTDSIHDVDSLLAVIDWEEWDSFDFDNVHWMDRIHMQVGAGDYEAVAKEQMSLCDDVISDHLTEFFDYSGYGKQLIEDEYESVDFNGTMYVLHRHV